MIEDDEPEALLGGTGQASGGDPIADKQAPPPRPQRTPPKAVVMTRLETGDSPHAIPLQPPAQNDGS